MEDKSRKNAMNNKMVNYITSLRERECHFICSAYKEVNYEKLYLIMKTTLASVAFGFARSEEEIVNILKEYRF